MTKQFLDLIGELAPEQRQAINGRTGYSGFQF
jgi:hypothetical protein